MPDDAADRCPLCLEGFSFLNRKHHCRVCGLLVCNACSPREVGGTHARCCNECFRALAAVIADSESKGSQIEGGRVPWFRIRSDKLLHNPIPDRWRAAAIVTAPLNATMGFFPTAMSFAPQKGDRSPGSASADSSGSASVGEGAGDGNDGDDGDEKGKSEGGNGDKDGDRDGDEDEDKNGAVPPEPPKPAAATSAAAHLLGEERPEAPSEAK
jgi:hypothetical protein